MDLKILLLVWNCLRLNLSFWSVREPFLRPNVAILLNPETPSSKMSGPKFQGHTPGMNPNAHRFFDGFTCKEAMDASHKCMTDNGYDYSKCGEYFEAYKECKKEWLQAKRKQNRLDLLGWESGIYHSSWSIAQIYYDISRSKHGVHRLVYISPGSINGRQYQGQIYICFKSQRSVSEKHLGSL